MCERASLLGEAFLQSLRVELQVAVDQDRILGAQDVAHLATGHALTAERSHGTERVPRLVPYVTD
ncbi:MAG TPA: hypothetical protein VJM84_04020 [Actinomycetota bacterium]|nr:hypothetical protein [Actinomycetota bacterium]